MSYKKEFSKGCRMCGVDWLDDMSNKAPKRALCKECLKKWQDEWNEKNKHNKYKMSGGSRKEKYKNFKMDVRKPYWKKINDTIRSINKREDWLKFIQFKMEEILNNEELMDYINDTEINK